MANKRGLSEVVATVMIVLLVIVAISIIAAFVVPFIRNSLQKSTECMNYRDYFRFDETFGLNCYQGNLVGFSVKAASDSESSGDIKGFKIVVASKDGSSKGANVQKIVYGDADGNGILEMADFNIMGEITYTHVRPMPSPGTDLFLTLDVNGDGELTGDINPNTGDDLEFMMNKILSANSPTFRLPIETMAGHARMIGISGIIEIPAGGETISYVYTSAGGELSGMSIYPMLKSGRICSEGDTVQLSACGAGVNLT